MDVVKTEGMMEELRMSKMIDPADVWALLEAYDYSDQSYNDRVDLINGLRDLLQKPDCPKDMFGMWAEHPEYGRALVCNARPDKDGEVAIVLRDDATRTGVAHTWAKPTELSFPEQHPETLTALEDYENAPEGTIVEYTNKMPYMKQSHLWVSLHGHAWPEALADTPTRVLRWGWGE